MFAVHAKKNTQINNKCMTLHVKGHTSWAMRVKI